ncbi:acetyl-CoA carboxylase, carboxyltransferase subunit beta [Solibaculum mannosilyticum]|uniref:acetyl-CoA carboxylase, carboxyltransferase subunit beta n=1 Tax=Solibaculum mannosilyticum TaxID=2780922 RepID=UPI0007A89BC9|nr:Acetyl-coenzyme A carboxylase carboxyl transferase subunit beta [Eubacteriaceae bacterium CHKCI005]
MNIKDLFIRNKDVLPPPQKAAAAKTSGKVTKQLWVKCPSCKRMLYERLVIENDQVCPACGHHFRLTAGERLKMTVDPGSFEEFPFEIEVSDPLNFPDYPEKLKRYRKETGLKEAVVCGVGKIHGLETVLCVMDSHFMMGSMGRVVGESITRSVEYATEHDMPIVIFATSGGARMQEGIVSLMQMAKISGALQHHSDAGLLYITVITDPTTGGVTASFASLGDVIVAEKNALIGFAGKRVVEQTINQRLPQNFQRAEFAQECGFVDIIVERSKMKDTLWKLLYMHMPPGARGEAKQRREQQGGVE